MARKGKRRHRQASKCWKGRPKRRSGRQGLAPLCIAVVRFGEHLVLVERELPRRGKKGVALRVGFPGGKEWQAWGIEWNTLREACEELGLPQGSLVAEHYFGSWHHPQFPARVTHYTLCLFKEGMFFNIRAGRNIQRIILATPDEMVALTTTTIFPPVANYFGLTNRKIRAIRKRRVGSKQ